MRSIALTVLLTVALAGCANVRKGLGEYQKAADKGVNIGGPPVDGGGDTGGKKKADLPAGLGGDKAHAQYSAPQG